MVDTDIEDRLAVLRLHYLETVSRNLDLISGAWQSLLEGGERSVDVIANIRYHAHRLAGGSGSFGLHDLGAAARELETAAEPMMGKAWLNNHDHEVISMRIAGLRDAFHNLTHHDHRADAAVIRQQTRNDIVLVVGDFDEETGDKLQLLESFGYSLRYLPVGEAQADMTRYGHPAAVLIDINLLDYGAEIAARLGDINAWEATPPPMIIVSRQDDFRTRLRALRSGGVAFLVHPFTDVDLVDTIDRLSPPTGRSPIRVLIIDDEASLAAYYTMILEAAGMKCRAISNPSDVLSVSTDFDPEIIVTDLYMPLCSGDEIAGVLRQKPEFDGVPIIFLSGEADPERQFHALHRGADDFLTKPITATGLVSSVTTRARRFRNLRARISQDSLTGLLNHTTIKQRLEIEMARAERTGEPMTFAILDIDRFKLVNDKYGHPTGDRVIKALSRMLVQRLRKTDIVGRYGGEEFAAVLPGADAETALAVLEDLRESFSQVLHVAGDETFTCTFSAGIAEAGNGILDLTTHADQAMYKAKETGRNRIVVAGR